MAASGVAGSLCEFGSRPAMAAVPTRLTTMTETAAPAISGWIRVFLIASMVSAPEVLRCCMELD
jgi:hypothetical protein